MINNTDGINTEIKVNGQRLETVTSFKYLGSVITDYGSKPEILSRIAQTTAALTRLKPVWNDRTISLSSKIRLMHSLVTSIFLFACESWILTAELQKRIPAMEMQLVSWCFEPSQPQRITCSATARYYTSHTNTMLPTRKSMPRSSRQSDHTKNT